MAVAHAAKGWLIAVEGTCGLDVTAGAKRLARALRHAAGAGGVSIWDSSGIFTELAAAGPDVSGPTARTLTLLYGADLAFRLRWQIRPALESGHWIVAAPYIQSAIGLGMAAGIPKRWLMDLFRFAPAAHFCYRISERTGPGTVAAAGGYLEFFCRAIEAGGEPIDRARLRTRSSEYLAWLERRRRCTTLTARELARLGNRLAPVSPAALRAIRRGASRGKPGPRAPRT